MEAVNDRGSDVSVVEGYEEIRDQGADSRILMSMIT